MSTLTTRIDLPQSGLIGIPTSAASTCSLYGAPLFFQYARPAQIDLRWLRSRGQGLRKVTLYINIEYAGYITWPARNPVEYLKFDLRARRGLMHYPTYEGRASWSAPAVTLDTGSTRATPTRGSGPTAGRVWASF